MLFDEKRSHVDKADCKQVIKDPKQKTSFLLNKEFLLNLFLNQKPLMIACGLCNKTKQQQQKKPVQM